MLRILSATCIAVYAMPGAAHADVSEGESLSGVEGVQIVIERLHPDAEQVSLSRAVIEIEVLRRLRDAGIESLSLDERMEDPRRPYLYVNCNLMYVPQIELASFSIDVEMHQRVTLEGGEKAQGLTWAKSYLGIQGKDTAASKVREVVGQLVDQFIAEHRAANAPEATPEEA